MDTMNLDQLIGYNEAMTVACNMVREVIAECMSSDDSSEHWPKLLLNLLIDLDAQRSTSNDLVAENYFDMEVPTND